MKDKKAREDDNETREMVNRLMDEVLEQGKRVDGLTSQLVENRCISHWDHFFGPGKERIDIAQMDKKLNALCEFLGVEWTVEPSKFVVIDPGEAR